MGTRIIWQNCIARFMSNNLTAISLNHNSHQLGCCLQVCPAFSVLLHSADRSTAAPRPPAEASTRMIMLPADWPHKMDYIHPMSMVLNRFLGTVATFACIGIRQTASSVSINTDTDSTLYGAEHDELSVTADNVLKLSQGSVFHKCESIRTSTNAA